MARFIDIPQLTTEIVCHVLNSLDLTMTLTFDFWPWKPLQLSMLMRCIFVSSIVDILLLSTEMSRRVEKVLSVRRPIYSKTYCLYHGFFNGREK